MSNGEGFRYGLGIAFRVGAEMLVATLLGSLMGFALDKFFDTSPWFLIAGVFLGGAAGTLNVYRTAQTFDEDKKNHSNRNDG